MSSRASTSTESPGPYGIQAASTFCALLGSATVVAHTLFQQDDHMYDGRRHVPGGSAEVAAAALLMVSLAFEALVFRQRQRAVAAVGPKRGNRNVVVAEPQIMAQSSSPQNGTGSCSGGTKRRRWCESWWPPPTQLLMLLGLTIAMGGCTALGGRSTARWLGIVPRTWGGLPGVVFGCFVHLNWKHYIWNAIGILLLGSCAFRAAAPGEAMSGRDAHEVGGDIEDGAGYYEKLSTCAAVSAFIAITSGFCVWCLARPAVHAGASGVVCGYVGLLVALTLRRRDVPVGSLLMVLAVLACYGGAALMSARTGTAGRYISPLYEACASRTTSSEHHTFGFLSGLASAVLVCQPRSQRNHAIITDRAQVAAAEVAEATPGMD
jgi:membrane associated rhomboid family serine protease